MRVDREEKEGRIAKAAPDLKRHRHDEPIKMKRMHFTSHPGVKRPLPKDQAEGGEER